MSEILNRIKSNQQYFETPSRRCQYVEVMDIETGESIDMPCSIVFNSMVLAIKDTGYRSPVSIIHRRDSLIRKDGNEEIYFHRYQLGEDGFVHLIKAHGGYSCYGERDKA